MLQNDSKEELITIQPTITKKYATYHVRVSIWWLRIKAESRPQEGPEEGITCPLISSSV
jgi:hypothetical protein